MNAYLQDLIRQKSTPLKTNFLDLKISSNRTQNKSIEKPSTDKILYNLKKIRKNKEILSPTSARFVRKTTKYDGYFRKVTFIKKIKLPNRESIKDVQRKIMDKDERKLIESLESDQKVYNQDISLKLASTITSYSRSPKRKLRVQLSEFLN